MVKKWTQTKGRKRTGERVGVRTGVRRRVVILCQHPLPYISSMPRRLFFPLPPSTALLPFNFLPNLPPPSSPFYKPPKIFDLFPLKAYPSALSSFNNLSQCLPRKLPPLARPRSPALPAMPPTRVSYITVMTLHNHLILL